MKIAVIGSRNFKDYDLLKSILDQEEDITEIISGGADGADSMAAKYAKENNINLVEFKADWNDLSHPDAIIKKHADGREYDAMAGIRRNTIIIEACDKVIAFHQDASKGTEDSLMKAKKFNKKIKVIKPELL